jgi:PadR family transcriptional regulator PadR
MCDRHHNQNNCRCAGGRMERFIQPCILLLVFEKPTHGYELMEKLTEFGFETTDPGAVYRNLRKMEEEGWVKSEWETEGTGPAKRLYAVTPEGENIIHDWADNIQRNIIRLSYFVDRYRKDFKI